MTIKEIESLTFEKAKSILGAAEEVEIKGYDCLLIDLGSNFGYSALVFKNGKQICYANDYQLHHNNIVHKQGKAALRQYYLQSLNHKLFTLEEIREGPESYAEYLRMDNFLRNYFHMQYDYRSIFGIDSKKEKGKKKEKEVYPFFSNVSFCYFKQQEIVTLEQQLHQRLFQSLLWLLSQPSMFREMVRSELANHEAGITGGYQEALNSLGLQYSELSDWQANIVHQELEKFL